jgi:hypothetical protein
MHVIGQQQSFSRGQTAAQVGRDQRLKIGARPQSARGGLDSRPEDLGAYATASMIGNGRVNYFVVNGCHNGFEFVGFHRLSPK